jgi:hypothetical protein
VQTTVNYWLLHVVRELDHPVWIQQIRETVRPRVLDVGSNLNQFGNLIRSINPLANVTTVDPLPEMHAQHRVAIGTGNTVALWRSTRGKTAGCYADEAGQEMKFPVVPLDSFRFDPPLAFDLVKIDVDGGEVDVLASGVKLLRDTPMALIECRPATMPSVFLSMELLGFNRRSSRNGWDWFFWKDGVGGAAATRPAAR